MGSCRETRDEVLRPLTHSLSGANLKLLLFPSYPVIQAFHSSTLLSQQQFLHDDANIDLRAFRCVGSFKHADSE